jgi:hypothetical protein
MDNLKEIILIIIGIGIGIVIICEMPFINIDLFHTTNLKPIILFLTSIILIIAIWKLNKE